MAPKLRKSARRKRRRRLAIPFIATFALGSAAACSGGGTVGPTTTSNPPPPRMIDAGTETMAPTPDAQTATVDPGTNLPPAPASGGTMFMRDDGTCWFSHDVNCPTDADGNMAPCNPPPPTQVECPPPLPDAPEGGEVTVSDDGTCWWKSGPVDCPENTKCNPPPPRQVKCADAR